MASILMRTGLNASVFGHNGGLRNAVSRSMALIALMLRVAKERRRLKALSHDQLRDIGLSRSAAHYEANRPFWDVPANRPLF